MLQGASNLWFPILISALSIPHAVDELGRLVEENWTLLDKATSLEVLIAFRNISQLRGFTKFSDDDIWKAIQKKRASSSTDSNDPDDLKSPEWRIFSDPTRVRPSKNFKLQAVSPPTEFAKYFDKIVLVEKLREVRSLVGFTRLLSPRDFDRPKDLPPENRAAPLPP